MNGESRVFVVDDDEAMRHSLSLLLRTAGYSVETFASPMDFLESCDPGSGGCLILDVKMPEMDGPTLQTELSMRGLQLPVIFLTGYGTIPMAVSAVKAGAIDFLTKPVDGALLLGRVRDALRKNLEMADQMAEYKNAADLLAKLTHREREIMMLAIAGHPNKEIGRVLGISYRTVEIHRSQILKKTGANNLLDLARIASLADTPN
ncbi:MAG TPA: response regulator [Burkholderiales bacterium]|nr:response regulator [Burkholderiales bacterium]